MARNYSAATSGISTMTSGDSKVFDLQGTLRRLGGDHSLLADLVQLYDEDSPALLNRLTQAIPEGNWDQIRHAAHSLRGLAANFGAAWLTEHLRQLEDAAVQQNLREAPQLLKQVQDDSARLQVSLAVHRRR